MTIFCAADLDLTLTGDSAYECFGKLQSAMTQAETEVDLKASYAHSHPGSGVAAAISIATTESALGTGSSDGELKICADSGNRYTWESTGSKWRVMDGNKYTTVNLPTSTTYNIATGTRAFDTTTGTWKDYNGSSFAETIPPATATAQLGFPLSYAATGNTITLNPVHPNKIRTANTAAAPSTGTQDVLFASGYGKMPEEQAATAITIAASAASVSVPIPSGYNEVTLYPNGIFGTANDTLMAYKNSTATANNHWDMMSRYQGHVAATGDINCATIVTGFSDNNAVSMNFSAMDMPNGNFGTSQAGAAYGTITVLGASGANFQDVNIDLYSAPVGGTATGAAGFHDVHIMKVVGKCKSTAKMTALVLIPRVGTFQGGTITLRGRNV